MTARGGRICAVDGCSSLAGKGRYVCRRHRGQSGRQSGGQPKVEGFVNTPTHRTCTAGCGRTLPRSSFFVDRTKKYGYGYECKDCHRLRRRQRAGWQIDEKTLARMDAITSCQVCGSEDDLTIDHCHDSGVVRGKLCGKCNRSLGNMRESADLLRRLADYIEMTAVVPSG